MIGSKTNLSEYDTFNLSEYDTFILINLSYSDTLTCQNMTPTQESTQIRVEGKGKTSKMLMISSASTKALYHAAQQRSGSGRIPPKGIFKNQKRRKILANENFNSQDPFTAFQRQAFQLQQKLQNERYM